MQIPFEYGSISTRQPVMTLVNDLKVWNFSNTNNEIYNSRSVLIKYPGLYDLVFYYATAGNGGKGDVSVVITNLKRDEDDVETTTVQALGQIDCYGSSAANVVKYPNIVVNSRSVLSIRIQANGKQLLSTGYNILGSSFMLLENV